MAIETVSKGDASEYYLEPLEVMKMLNSADSIRNRLVIELLFECGIRRFELVNIEVKDVNLAKREIYIRRGKGGKPDGKNDKERRARQVFIKDNKILADLKAYIGGRTKGRLIQSNNKQHDGIDLSGINRIVAKVSKLAGIECPNPNRKQVHPHLLRHSFGRREDLDLASKQKIMGHRNVGLTAGLYGGVSSKDAKKRFMQTPSPLSEQGETIESPTKQLTFCENCGQKINSSANFCKFCGTSQT